MTTSERQPTQSDLVVLALESLHKRVAALERPDTSFMKRLTENAGAIALFLGLVLTFASLYDVFFAKPAADRVEAIGKFNQAVNSAAQVRQEMLEMQLQTADPVLQMTVAAMATPRALNNISTARSLLSDLDDSDIGIPQLIVLISESFTTGDLGSAGEFIDRAVNKSDTTPYLRSEALRYKGKFLFLKGEPAQGRAAFESAMSQLAESPGSAAQRAYILADFVSIEFVFGDCTKVGPNIERLVTLLNAPGVTRDARRQIGTTLHGQLQQTQGPRCVVPNAAAELI
jgi:hypothetical protein